MPAAPVALADTGTVREPRALGQPGARRKPGAERDAVALDRALARAFAREAHDRFGELRGLVELHVVSRVELEP